MQTNLLIFFLDGRKRAPFCFAGSFFLHPRPRHMISVFTELSPLLSDGEIIFHPIAASLVWAFTQRWSQDCQGSQANAIFKHDYWMGNSVGLISYINPHVLEHKKVAVLCQDSYFSTIANTIISTYYDDPNLDGRLHKAHSRFDNLTTTLAKGDIYLAYEHTSAFRGVDIVNNIKKIISDCAKWNIIF
jgi:hypothetical protein